MHPATTAFSSASASASPAPVRLHEVELESRMGAVGTEDTRRTIPVVDLSDFEQRRAEITESLWQAATEVGFFQLSHHGIAPEQVRAAFEASERFFALPEASKARWPLHRNAGWESRAQVRPSTGTPDQKESYQITRPRMQGLWPSEAELPGFVSTMLAFESASWAVGMRVLSCFADRLGFERDFFARAHDPAQATYQSTLRLLHYHAIPPEALPGLELWRAGAHTDFDCLTLLFQREGQGGLQVCPGKDHASQAWTEVPAREALITCNIGDMLMRWSDDRLPSNFHRVRNPRRGESLGPRYSLAFFCQANTDAVIQGPGRLHAPITAGDFLAERVRANFRAG